MVNKVTKHTIKISESSVPTILPNRTQSHTLIRMQESKRHKLLHAKNSKVKILKIGQNSIIIKKMVEDNKHKMNMSTQKPTTSSILLSTVKLAPRLTNSSGRTRECYQQRHTTRLHSKVTVEFFLKITKSRSKLSFANNGLQINLVLITIPVPSLMESMSFKRRSMFHLGTRLSFAASF